MNRTALIDLKRDLDVHELSSIIHRCSIHTSSCLAYAKEPESKVDKAVEILKETISEPQKSVETAAPASSIVPRPSLWQRVKAELKHYYIGCKLLSLEIKITYRLLKQVLNGHDLTRRERKHVIYLRLNSIS